MREVFAFHEKNEGVFGHLKSRSRVLLYRPSKSDKEYLGWFILLKQAHVLFDVLDHVAAEDHPERASGYDILIVPDPVKAPAAMMDAARATGGKLLFSALTDGRAEKALALLGACCEGTLERTRAAYLSTADKALFASFPDRDWVILDREFGLLSGGKGVLPLVQPAMFGPPERCFGHVQSSWPGLVFSADGKSAGFAFRIGRLFHDDGYADHRDIAVAALRALSPEAFVLETNAPAAAELFLHTLPDGRTLLQLINLTGWNGMTMEKALPLSDIRISLPGEFDRVSSLDGAALPQLSHKDGRTELLLNAERLYQGYLLP